MFGGLAEMTGRLVSAGTVDSNTYTWHFRDGGLSSGTSCIVALSPTYQKDRHCKASFDLASEVLNIPSSALYWSYKSLRPAQTQGEEIRGHKGVGGRSSKEYVSIFNLSHHSSNLSLD